MRKEPHIVLAVTAAALSVTPPAISESVDLTCFGTVQTWGSKRSDEHIKSVLVSVDMDKRRVSMAGIVDGMKIISVTDKSITAESTFTPPGEEKTTSIVATIHRLTGQATFRWATKDDPSPLLGLIDLNCDRTSRLMD